MHIPLLPHRFDFLMSLLQISPQLIKVKQNSHFRSRGGVMQASRKCMESINAFCNWFALNQMQLKKNTQHTSPHAIGVRTASTRLGACQVGFDRVSWVSTIDLPCENEMTEEFVALLITLLNSPVSAVPNSLEPRAMSPFWGCDNTATARNRGLTAEQWQTGWEAEQTGKLHPVVAVKTSQCLDLQNITGK